MPVTAEFVDLNVDDLKEQHEGKRERGNDIDNSVMGTHRHKIEPACAQEEPEGEEEDRERESEVARLQATAR